MGRIAHKFQFERGAVWVFSTASGVWPRFTQINPQLQYSYHAGRCGDGVGPGRLSCVSAVEDVPFGHGRGSRVQPHCSLPGVLPSPAIWWRTDKVGRARLATLSLRQPMRTDPADPEMAGRMTTDAR
jgi:hypothetical protein